MVSMMFHKGALIPDKSGLPEGEGKETSVARFIGAKDVKKKKKALESVLKQWIKMRDNESD